VIVELFQSTLPAGVLYDEKTLPALRVDTRPASTTGELADAQPAVAQQQRVPARHSLRDAQTRAPLDTRQMAPSLLAIDEQAEPS
jgi:hypothetical protein